MLSKDLDTSVFGATMLNLLSDSLSLDEIAEIELEDLAVLLQEKGRGRFSDPQKSAKTIKKEIGDSYRIVYTACIITKNTMKLRNLNTNEPLSLPLEN